MILGIGTDIIEVERIRASVERFGDRFLQRVFRPAEVAYCQSHKFAAPHLAARFAAKEAISKAFGTGIGKHLSWKDMEIMRRDSGEPYVLMHDAGAKLLQERGASRICVSLSHTQTYATAMATLEG